MRRSIGRSLSTHPIGAKTLIPSSSFLFSTSSGGDGGGGRGRGRGRGSSSSAPSPFAAFTPNAPGKPDSDDPNHEPSDAPSPHALGHGRGKPIPPSPVLPSFSSWTPPGTPPTSAGRGQSQGPKKPIFFLREEVSEMVRDTETRVSGVNREESGSNLPASIISAVSGGAGRGKPPTPASPKPPGQSVQEENRHLRASPRRGRGDEEPPKERSKPAGPKLSVEEAVQKAMGILSHGGEPGRGGGGGGGGRGSRGRGGRGGRGDRQGWRGGRGRRDKDLDDDTGAGLYLGDNADGEKLAKKLGVENMNHLVEAFEEMSGRVLPSPVEDAYLDAVDVNYAIECEPEYLMGDFESNPDIDEKPPMSLRDALDKMKPFLMAYENIQSHEEWEEVVEETMKGVPLMKEIVDHYSGPDRVTAKRQQEELERVAETLPESAPASVKKFANRAVTSLQSNPGWGFDKKCQFMDKLVWHASQQYK